LPPGPLRLLESQIRRFLPSLRCAVIACFAFLGVGRERENMQNDASYVAKSVFDKADFQSGNRISY
jgi:hypothetical protein